MEFNSIDEVFDFITGIRAKLFAVAEQIPLELGGKRPSPDAWSAAQILDHLGWAEEFMVSQIREQLAQANADLATRSPGSQGAAEKTCYFRPISMEKVVEKAKGQKLIAPEPLVGRQNAAVHQALDRLRVTRADLMLMRPQIETLDLSEMRFSHFAFGELSVYEWIALNGMHERRHLEQIIARLPQAQEARAD